MKRFRSDLAAERITQHVTARLNAGILGGVAAGVWIDGKQVVDLSLGFRDPIEHVPMTRDAIFRMASMTKPVAGCAVMQMAEQGKLDLDAPVSRWLPSFAHMQVAQTDDSGNILSLSPAQQPITPRILLCHASGLGSGPVGQQFMGTLHPEDCPTLAAAVEQYARSPLAFQPNTAQMYSGLMGMDVLVRLVELISDTPYAEYAKEHIFDPLEMPDTTFRPVGEQLERVVRLTDYVDGRLWPVDIAPDKAFVSILPAGYPGGGVGLFSTLEDYSHFALMYLNGGRYKGVRILKPETIAEMTRPQLPDPYAAVVRRCRWGLSMRVRMEQYAPVWKEHPAPDEFPADALADPGQPLTPGSFGWSGAHGTHFWVDPKENMVAIYLTNLLDGHGADAPTAFEFERDVMSGFTF